MLDEMISAYKLGLMKANAERYLILTSGFFDDNSGEDRRVVNDILEELTRCEFSGFQSLAFDFGYNFGGNGHSTHVNLQLAYDEDIYPK
jgi:hypothetical protein